MAARGLVCELPPIESGDRGESEASISNVRSESQRQSKETRVGQLVMTPVRIAEFVLDLGEAERLVLAEGPGNKDQRTRGAE